MKKCFKRLLTWFCHVHTRNWVTHFPYSQRIRKYELIGEIEKLIRYERVIYCEICGEELYRYKYV